MTDKIMALLAYIVLAAFLVILVWHVPRLDLGAIVLLTLIFAGIDALSALRSHQASRTTSPKDLPPR